MRIGHQFSHSASHFDAGRGRSEAAHAFGAPTGAGQPGGTPYTIQKGDTLWGLADRMRSGGDTRGNWDIIGEIARDNGIKNPDLILTGNALNLRGPLGGDTFAPAKDPTSPLTGTAAGTPGAQGDGVPYISQNNPAGAGPNYKNGEENCGPTVMAMIAREHGMGGNMNDADLITALGKVGHTDAGGTSGNGLIAMADQMGLKTASEPGANSNWVMGQLAQGKDVVANGDYFALPQHADANQTSPHYILLTGIDANGNIQVKDPADPNVKSITPGQLDAFNQAHPDGGFNISFG